MADGVETPSLTDADEQPSQEVIRAIFVGGERQLRLSLRDTLQRLREAMRARVHGQDATIVRLAEMGALHLHGVADGQRTLIIGPSGSGKSLLLATFAEAMRTLCDFDSGLPVAHVEANDLVGPAWAGGKTVGALVRDAIGGYGAFAADRPLIMIDEVHWIRRTDAHTIGNMRQKQEEVYASLLALTAGGVVALDGGTSWSAHRALVLLAGAFTGLTWTGGAPTAADLTRYGFPYELANRVAGEPLVLSPLDRAATAGALARWGEAIAIRDSARALGVQIDIADVTIAALTAMVMERGASFPLRAAGSALTSAVRAALTRAVEADDAPERVLVLPDDLRVWLRGREEPHVQDWRGEDGDDRTPTP